MKTDEELLELFVAGDEAAFDEIHSRHAEDILNIVKTRYLDGDAQLAKDVVQATFMALRRQHEKFDRRMKLAPWLFGIAVNCSIDTARARGKSFAHSFDSTMLKVKRAKGNSHPTTRPTRSPHRRPW